MDVMTLLRHLGCDHIKETRSSAWIASTCPLAAWRHKGGVDKHPSFGVSVHAGGESKFKCYTCGESGSLIGENGLLRRVRQKSKKPVARIEGMDAYVWVDLRNEPSQSQLEEKAKNLKNVSGWQRDIFKNPTDPTGFQLTAQTAAKLEEAPPPLAESELSRFTLPTPEVMRWLQGFEPKERRLTQASIEQWELKWHEGARRLAIPIRDIQGQLVGISGRAHDGQRPKFLHSSGFRRDFYIYGERFCRKGETGYLTEGFFDVMYLHQNKFNAFAIMGSYLSRMQIEKIVSMFTRVVIVPDGDEPGEEAAKRILPQLNKHLPTVVSPMEEGKDPDDLSDSELDALRLL